LTVEPPSASSDGLDNVGDGLVDLTDSGWTVASGKGKTYSTDMALQIEEIAIQPRTLIAGGTKNGGRSLYHALGKLPESEFTHRFF